MYASGQISSARVPTTKHTVKFFNFSRRSFFFPCLYLISIPVLIICDSDTTQPSPQAPGSEAEEDITATVYECSISGRTFNKDLKRVEKVNVDSDLSYGNISRTFWLSKTKRSPSCYEAGQFMTEYVRYKVRRVQVRLVSLSEARSSISFLPTGQIRHFFNDRTVATIYNPNEYCIRRFNDTHMEVQVCTSSCDLQKPKMNTTEVCISKCCAPGYAIDFDGDTGTSSLTCSPSGENQWTPTFFDAYREDTMDIASTIDQNLTVNYRMFNRIGQWCSAFIIYVGIPRTENGREKPGYTWRLLNNGKVIIHNPNRNPLKLDTKWENLPQKFCIDGVQNFGEDEFYINRHENQIVMACTEEQPEKEINTYVYITAYFVSLVPLGLTIFAYWVTWDAQNIHGWTVFSHIVALFLMNLFFGTSFLVSFAKDHESFEEGNWGRVGCVILGVLTHFFFLSTFCWLTMVNFDLWCTFRSLTQTIRKSKGFSRFVVYALISWGGPLVVIIVGLSLDQQQEDDSGGSSVIVPNYGKQRCYLQHEAQGVYIYSLLGVLNLVNLVFFSATVYALYNYRKSTQVAVRGKSTQEMTSGELFIKLFVVMGATFILELISWVVESDYHIKDVPWIWVAIDVLNITVRAVLIFVIFACKRQTLLKLKSLTKDYRKPPE